jgi:hypothetical protein
MLGHKFTLRFKLTGVLALAAVAVAGVEPVWVVPEESAALSVLAEGTVEINRASVQTIRPGSSDAVVTYIGPDGRYAEFGDILLEMDTSDLKRRHERYVEDLAVYQASRKYSLDVVSREVEGEKLELKDLLANFQTLEAKARAAAKPDPAKISRLKLEIDLARREADLQEVELKRMRHLLALGELARVKVEDAELALAAAKRQVRIAELELVEAKDGSDEVAARRAQWLVQRNRLSMGLDENGQVQPHRGLGKEMAGTQARYQHKDQSTAALVDAKQVAIQVTARAAWPHVPLKTLTISGEQGEVSVLDGTAEDAAAVYDSDRGSGWLKAPVTAPSAAALVVRGQETWRCDLPRGTYKLDFELGDVSEWGCMYVKAADKVVLADNRLPAGETRRYTASVTVDDGPLLLHFGLKNKAIVASSSGTVKNQNWVYLGYHINNNPPALYLTPTVQLVIKLRAHHLQASFFGGAVGVDTNVSLQTKTGDWVPGGKVVINEDPVPFFPPPPTRYSWSASDVRADERTAREVTVAVQAEHVDGFPFAAHVSCRAQVTAKPGSAFVPAYLVFEGDDSLYVQRDGELQAVAGTRLDQHFVITEGVKPGDRLERPRAAEKETVANRFTGEVIPATAVSVKAPIRSWARIASLVPHGSRVKKGDLIITLYRPEETSGYHDARAKASGGASDFLEASEKQIIEFLKQTSAHATAVETEKVAADRVAENRRQDQAVLAAAAEAQRAVEAELKLLDSRVDTLSGKESSRLELDRYRRRRDIVALQARSRRLNAISTYRRVSYTQQLSDQFAWRTARRDLATREAKIDINLQTESIMSQRALTMLEDSLEDAGDAYDFERDRFVKAPADGHVFYQKGYNDLAKRRERIAEEFVVWDGLTMAEILDKSSMSFKVSLPEDAYGRIETGMELPIELEDLDDRILTGRVVVKGRSLYEPKRSSSSSSATEAVALRRVFDVRLSFDVPDDLQGRLRPGLRGAVTLR